MLFNSLQFAFFFIIVWCLYLLLKHQWQNRLLLLARCVFYAAWDWRFLGLIFISITADMGGAQKFNTEFSGDFKRIMKMITGGAEK